MLPLHGKGHGKLLVLKTSLLLCSYAEDRINKQSAFTFNTRILKDYRS